MCHVSPIVEGFSVENAVNRIDIGGRDVTNYLNTLLIKAGYSFHTSAELEIVKDIKEHFCQLSTQTRGLKTFEKKKDLVNEKNQALYVLPDGESLGMTSETFKAPEILF